MKKVKDVAPLRDYAITARYAYNIFEFLEDITSGSDGEGLEFFTNSITSATTAMIHHVRIGGLGIRSDNSRKERIDGFVRGKRGKDQDDFGLS